MPYIDEELRGPLARKVMFPCTPGELNFLITSNIVDYLPANPRYDDYNKIIGVLECVKMEFYRRMVAPYEDDKIKENGDVY